ncbi:MAG: hypothetical protein U0235_00900 [Polyangiaceae bacterium]
MLECVECRASLRTVRQHFQRYGELVGKAALSNEEMLALATDAVFLWNQSILRDAQRLRRIKNRALRQVPEAAATRAIEALVASLPKP